eukprot:CAMPEP_0169203544 /NCGR_PEP_ID=MMETSP1016-20121227/11523_1 /TAXON_ID=342587 /ORGANISM="Karlodinium micrum, Strain CCMP2283" /LENGTH=824 /DNA_ID=CAMNT_0009280595 /DNA_START=35 /DNA_END=2509 /DNA_ORIENTATION=-
MHAASGFMEKDGFLKLSDDIETEILPCDQVSRVASEVSQVGQYGPCEGAGWELQERKGNAKVEIQGLTTVDSDRSGAELTLQDHVDQVERSLGLALKAYRQKAEEILDHHFEVMEAAQAQKDHQLATLKAENFTLRQLLGIKPPEASVSQNVLFQTNTGVVDAKTKRKDTTTKVQRTASDENSPARLVGGKKKHDNAFSQPGGSWQQFVAWVPNGAALSNPEPWKPLPSINSHASANGAVMQAAPNQLQVVRDKGISFSPVLPGSVMEEKRKGRGGSGDDDEDDSDVGSECTRHVAKLQPDEMWQISKKELQWFSRGSRTVDLLEVSADGDSREKDFSCFDTDNPNVRKPGYIINPDSNVRIAWDLGSLLMVVWDMIMIPMIAFDMPEDTFLTFMDWTTRLFWTADIVWSCFTGVVLNDGTVNYDLRFILKRYSRTWLGLDLFIVGSDWFGLIFSSGGMGLSKLARGSRIARVVRLMRLVRMQEVIANITERVHSDKLGLVLQVLKVLIFLIATCHVIACTWFGIGDRSTDDVTWVSKYGYRDSSIGVQYLVSLHWSLLQYGGGMEEVRPNNELERVFAVIIWTFAFMTGLVMMSFLTSTMTQQYIIGGTAARQMATLKKYLKQNRVPKNLTKRLCRNAKHAISGDLTPDTVDLLHVVSGPLKIEMHFEMYSRILQWHPFFEEHRSDLNNLLRRVCHMSMAIVLTDQHDVLFSRGEEPCDPKVYFICSGLCDYVDMYGDSILLVERKWAAEATLWCQWKHQGTLTVKQDSKIAQLDARSFQDICQTYMKTSKSVTMIMKQYAKRFVEELNSADILTDLPVDLLR